MFVPEFTWRGDSKGDVELMVIAVDYDGVIHDHKHPNMRMGLPIDGAKEAITSLKELGHTIIIHSVKGDRPQHIAEWMTWYNIPYDRITREKPEADFYIDDKAIRFTSWGQTLNDMMDLVELSK